MDTESVVKRAKVDKSALVKRMIRIFISSCGMPIDL